MQDFLLFLLVGFLAQIVDGALGMAYGVISSTVLLSFGVPPATASASVHAAEVFTTAASAGSHTVNKNVNWKLFVPLALGGVVGGSIGAFVLTSIDGDAIRPFITAYLAVMGLVIIWRATRQTRERIFPRKFAGPLGLAGGFFDAVGGGGWGPTVATTLVGTGQDPVDQLDIGVEVVGGRCQVGGRAVGLQFDHVGGQLVGPGDRPVVDVRHLAAAEITQQQVDGGPDVEAFPVHHHVFQLEAEAFEQVQRLLAHGILSPVRSAIRFRNASMTRR